MSSRRKKKQRSRQPLAASPKTPSPLAASRGIRPWLLAAMTALVVARPLFPSESAAAHGDGLSTVMLWIALAVFWSLAAIGWRKNNSPLPKGEGPGVRATEQNSPLPQGEGPGVRATEQVSPRPLGEGPGVRAGWIDAAVVLLLLCIAASTFYAVRHGSPRPAINVFWEWIGLGLCFLLARQLIDTERESRALIAVMIALAVALSGYGFYQRAYEMPNTRALYKANPDAALRDAGLWFPPGSPQRKLYEDRLENPEPMATFALTNSLAGFLAPWLVVLAGIACVAVGGDSRRRSMVNGQSIGDRSRLPQERFWGQWRLIGAMVLFLPVGICLFLTHSRAGCIAALLGLALVWPIARGKTFRFGWKIPLAIVVAGTALIAGAAAFGKLDYQMAEKSFGYRLQYWRSSMAMIGDHPWLGCGPGNFQDAYTRYKLPEASEEIADPHNFLLEIWSTAGTPAAMAFLTVLGCFMWMTVRGRGSGVGGQRTEGGESRKGEKEGREYKMQNAKCIMQNDERKFPISKSPNLQIINHQSSIINHQSPDAWLHVLAGGAAGFLLSLPLGMLSEATPSAMAVLLGLPLAAAAVALLFGWIRDGHLPRLLPALGVAVLLVDLFAAGGIAFPGVAGSLWLLMALGLVGGQPRMMQSAWAWTALAGALALALICYATAYSPVLGCQTQLRMSEAESTQAVEHLKAAASADPWAAEPWLRLADAEFKDWLRSPNAEAFERFEWAATNLALRAPNSAQFRSQIGGWYSQAASMTDGSGKRIVADAAKKAVQAYRRTVDFYPNSALNRANLAEAYLAAGDRESYRREAETALRLDKATPHSDKKLPAELRNRLLGDQSDK